MDSVASASSVHSVRAQRAIERDVCAPNANTALYTRYCIIVQFIRATGVRRIILASFDVLRGIVVLTRAPDMLAAVFIDFYALAHTFASSCCCRWREPSRPSVAHIPCQPCRPYPTYISQHKTNTHGSREERGGNKCLHECTTQVGGWGWLLRCLCLSSASS